MAKKLSVSDLCYSYHTEEGETSALSRISFSLENGEFMAIVGPSGCGKSTLLSLLCGLLKPESGEILLDGRPLSEGKANIGYMLQRDQLFQWRTILSNVSLGLEIRKTADAEHLHRVQEMLSLYGLADFAGARPSELSGGMRQRAALVRTLALDPDILMLDEPFSALDYQTRLEVCDDISSIIRRRKKTAILVTHDLSEAISAADRILVLSRRPGRVKAIFDTPFQDRQASPLKRRRMPEFSACFDRLWAELKD